MGEQRDLKSRHACLLPFILFCRKFMSINPQPLFDGPITMTRYFKFLAISNNLKLAALLARQKREFFNYIANPKKQVNGD